MQRLGVTRQLFTRSSGQDYCPAAGLGNTILTSLMRGGGGTRLGGLVKQII